MNLLRKHLVLILLILAALLCWAFWGNTALKTTQYTVQAPKIPAGFEDYRIAHVSDLHNAEFDPGNRKLLALLQAAQPDMIAITGDLIDSRKTDPEIAIAFAREAAAIAPTYYVPGNHEARLPETYAALKNNLRQLGVVVLENESILVEKGTDALTLTGLLDPDFGAPWPNTSSGLYHVVLSHRPEQFPYYVQQSFDLVLSGHAHGGQFRLPFLGGLFAPHQGFFPQYTEGLHTQKNTTMAVSRGLGNSAFPLRLGNRPELVIVTLESV